MYIFIFNLQQATKDYVHNT